MCLPQGKYNGSSDDYFDAISGPVLRDEGYTEKDFVESTELLSKINVLTQKMVKEIYSVYPQLTGESACIISSSLMNIVLSIALAIRPESRREFIEDFVFDLRSLFSNLINQKRISS